MMQIVYNDDAISGHKKADRRSWKMEGRLSKRLIIIRKERRLTQQHMADLLDLPRSTYVHYELGWRSPELGKVIEFAVKLGVSIDYLLENSNFPLTVEKAIQYKIITLTQPIEPGDLFQYTIEAPPEGERIAEPESPE
jgi:transcriptional regulator with XRE-family HTH domain